VNQNEIVQIREYFGQVFLEKLERDLAVYTACWQLSELSLIDYFSVNCLFLCRSQIYGDAVLKIGNPCRETFAEIAMLREYGGGRFCRLYEADPENGVLLLEQIRPGTRLRDVPSLDKRLELFAGIFTGLHKPPADPGEYPAYSGWVSRIAGYMGGQPEHWELCVYMRRAEKLYLEAETIYSRKMLLHGDLHHDNLLLNEQKTYTIIDPKGVVGDPVFEVGRFILNEDEDGLPPDEYLCKVRYIIKKLKMLLGIPTDIIKKGYFIEMAMANCWNVESGEPPDLERVRLAAQILEDQ